MGWLRLALVALIVSGGSAWLSPAAAIRLLFVISGFFIAVAWHRTDQDRALAFYRSRWRHIYPMYLLLLLLSLLWWYYLDSQQTDTPTLRMWRQEAPTALQGIGIWLSQLSLVGLDWAQQLWVRPGLRLDRFLIMPYAWPLATELSFVLLAPQLLALPRYALAVLALAGLFWGAMGMPQPIADLSYFALGSLAWPLAARLKPLPLDRQAGQLSYALYLAYPLVFAVLAPYLTAGFLPLSLAVALLLWWWIELPLRQREGSDE